MTSRPTQKPASPWPSLLAPLLASLTLGLAPFAPEPHLVGKIRWLAGGGEGMALLDYGDLLFHGAPWLWLIGAIGYFALKRRAKAEGG